MPLFNTLHLQARWHYWYPAILTALISASAFIFVGNAPALRASAMALVLAGVASTLRRLGAPFAIGGALLLAFSPAYWSQVIASPTVSAWWVLALMGLGGVCILLMMLISRRLFISVALGISVFVGLYLAFGVTERSLRLTALLSAWLIYMLVTALRQTNPRPEEPPAQRLSNRHTYGVLLIMALGTLNDPLFILFLPSVVMGLWLFHIKLPVWYWLALLVTGGIGLWGIYDAYVAQHISFNSARLYITQGRLIPYLVFDAWQFPQRWLYLTDFIVRQFSFLGVILGVFGIARMSRWYPTLGIVLMLAYGSYGIWGLIYFGADASIVLLPMLMIQAICITYALYSLWQWMARLWRNPRGDSALPNTEKPLRDSTQT